MGGKRYLYTLKVCLKKINYKAARIRKKNVFISYLGNLNL